MQRCISQLPDTYRTVLLLRDIEGLDTGRNGIDAGHEPGGRQECACTAPARPCALFWIRFPGRRRMNCREFTEFLHDYLFGNLPAEERIQFEKHLAECP